MAESDRGDVQSTMRIRYRSGERLSCAAPHFTLVANRNEYAHLVAMLRGRSYLRIITYNTNRIRDLQRGAQKYCVHG